MYSFARGSKSESLRGGASSRSKSRRNRYIQSREGRTTPCNRVTGPSFAPMTHLAPFHSPSRPHIAPLSLRAGIGRTRARQAPSSRHPPTNPRAPRGRSKGPPARPRTLPRRVPRHRERRRRTFGALVRTNLPPPLPLLIGDAEKGKPNPLSMSASILDTLVAPHPTAHPPSSRPSLSHPSLLPSPRRRSKTPLRYQRRRTFAGCR